jgi:hypothetical protein
MIEILQQAGSNVFTVDFYTKPDVKEAKDKISKLYPNRGGKGVGIMSKEDYIAQVSAILDEVTKGNLRTLTGYILSTDNARGRITVVDMALGPKKGIRQVDPRTLQTLIINQVKYELK